MTVYLVGAGPGDPGLLTVRGAELLRRCDVVVHDRLIGQEMLALVRADTLRIDVGKAKGSAPVPQERINELLIEHGRVAECVVRLKGGDPFVFGRGGEEAMALAGADVAFEVVPGVSSALAAPAAAGIPLTLRNEALSFTVVTGHLAPSTAGSVDWQALAKIGGTLVILMAATRIGEIAAELQLGGLASGTPVAAVRWGTTGRQKVVRATLATIGSAGVRAPSTIVVGVVAAMNFNDPEMSGLRAVLAG